MLGKTCVDFIADLPDENCQLGDDLCECYWESMYGARPAAQVTQDNGLDGRPVGDMVGDGTCQTACYTKTMSYDSGDCGCAVAPDGAPMTTVQVTWPLNGQVYDGDLLQTFDDGSMELRLVGMCNYCDTTIPGNNINLTGYLLRTQSQFASKVI